MSDDRFYCRSGSKFFALCLLLSLMNHWSVKHALIESNSIGSPNLEALHEHLPQGRTLRGFETTAKSKPKLIQSLALCFERSHLQWLPDRF